MVLLLVLTTVMTSCKKSDDNSTKADALCSNGLKDGDETGVDCGGPCSACAVPNTCDDGIQNQGETGVDCGASGGCTECSISASDDITTAGFGGMELNFSMVVSAVKRVKADTLFNSSNQSQARVEVIYPGPSDTVQCTIYFYKKDFAHLPINKVQAFTCDTVSTNKINKCKVEGLWIGYGTRLKILTGSKVLVTRLAANSYNVHFYKIPTNQTSPTHAILKLGLNTNFSF